MLKAKLTELFFGYRTLCVWENINAYGFLGVPVCRGGGGEGGSLTKTRLQIIVCMRLFTIFKLLKIAVL
jgi:hypothetical protein